MHASQSPTPHLSGAARAARRASPPAGASHPGAHLVVDQVSHSYPGWRVLSELSFTARPGDRIGLIGENGSGKSTLLRILAGVLVPSSGTVSHPGTVGLLAQELPYPDHTRISQVLDAAQAAALDAFTVLERLGTKLAAEPDSPEVADAYAAALDAADRSGAWSAAAHRGEVLSGLGLGGISEQRTLGELSGGQRLRLALAALLVEAPHTLLLDEPSNHLDDAAAAYLERVLSRWPGIVIVASHDRALLDAITTRILGLDPNAIPARKLADAAPSTQPAGATSAETTSAGATPAGPHRAHLAAAPAGTEETTDPGTGHGARLWGVGYTAARTARRAELVRWRAQYDAECAELAALRHEIEVGAREVNRKHESKSESRITRKFYADKDARVTARRARNARVRLDTLERERIRRPPEPLRFTGFSGAANSDSGAELPEGPVLRAEEVAYEGRLAPTSLELPARGRLLLAGPNGAGKSTLLRILAGELAPHSGAVTRSVRVGYLPQEGTLASPERSAAEFYRDAVGVDRAEEHPLHGTGLLAARDLERAVGSLSVGQRRRLVLATLLADPPPILLLDEPTNHLSLTLVEELEEALTEFPGGLVLATHDRWFRERWSGPVLTLAPPPESTTSPAAGRVPARESS